MALAGEHPSLFCEHRGAPNPFVRAKRRNPQQWHKEYHSGFIRGSRFSRHLISEVGWLGYPSGFPRHPTTAAECWAPDETPPASRHITLQQFPDPPSGINCSFANAATATSQPPCALLHHRLSWSHPGLTHRDFQCGQEKMQGMPLAWTEASPALTAESYSKSGSMSMERDTTGPNSPCQTVPRENCSTAPALRGVAAQQNPLPALPHVLWGVS